MVKNKESRIDVNKTREMRTKEIASMINEGGLGADTYYNIKKRSDSGSEPNNLKDAINQLIANLGVQYIKIHQYHWHVKGENFFTLHLKFEELYDDTTAYLDEFAERLIAKDERPLSTLQEFLGNATISEHVYDKKITAKEMVKNLVEDYSEMNKEVSASIDLAAKETDSVTEDMLIAYKEYIDKTVWMLQSYTE